LEAFERPLHILLTNDDGIHAPGLAALQAAIALLPGARCTVVAPATEQSQCGHRVTTQLPLAVRAVGEPGANRYQVEGTPADCIRAAFFGLDLAPDLVVSGVNAGGNMGQDIVISGTVAGAREAAYHGVRAVAVSHYLVSGLAVDWERTSRWTAIVLEELLRVSLGDGSFWNVNLPHLPPGDLPPPTRQFARPCREPLNVSFAKAGTPESGLDLRYNARYAERPAPAGSDVAVCFGGNIAVSRLEI
jgi:5'-nucleotidase